MKLTLRHGIAIIVATIACIWMQYLFLPTIAMNFVGFPLILLIGVIICFLFSASDGDDGSEAWLTRLSAGLGTIIIGYIIIYSIFLSWSVFHANKYQQLLGQVQKSTFTTDIEPVSIEEIRTVDWETAEKIGDKLLGSDPSLGSRVVHGDYALQQVGGHLYWIAPLLHSGFFRWLNNNGTPGYVIVSATNAADARLVEQADGKDVLIRYQPKAFFDDNLKRHIRQSGYRSVGLYDYTFEVDDNFKPYWVVTAHNHTIGFFGATVTGILVIDPETGSITEYSEETAPEWIDRIQPADFVEDQIDDWGRFVHGWWNWSKRDMLESSHQPSLVYGSDGKCYFYTGITSVGKDEGTVGFMLVNSRTKAVKMYMQPGATEKSAKSSIEGKVQQMGYKSSDPVMYNIDNIPTYIMSLKDDEGLVKMMGMVSVTDYAIVGTGNTINEALLDYQSALVDRGNSIAPSGSAEAYEISTVVARVNSDMTNGSTYYYLILQGYENKIFKGKSSLSSDLPITREGDKVEVSYNDSKNEVVNMTRFENQMFSFQKTDQQVSKEKFVAKVDSTEHAVQKTRDVNAKWEEMSDEDKLKLFEKVNKK
jgi:ASC-1-like (ASCH) protein